MSDYGTGTPVGQRPDSGGGGTLKGLAKDKRFQFAAVAVAGIGAAVLFLRRGSATNPGDATAAAGAAGSRGYVQGGADTTGTDVASFLGNWGALQNQSIKDLIEGLAGNTPPPGAGIGNLGRVTGVRDNQPGVWRDSLQLGWNPVSGATGYQIRNYADPSKIIDVSGGSTDAYQIRDLVHNGSYFWQIRPIGPDGTMGDWSDYITTHTKN